MHATKTTNKSNEFLMMGQKKLAYISKMVRVRALVGKKRKNGERVE